MDAPFGPPEGSCGGITPAELAAVRGRLEAFAAEVLESLPRKDQRARGECYLRGLMLDGRRKSIEPMAARLKEVHYQALHHFVAVSPWDWRPVRRRLAERLVGEVEPTAWAVDDTGFPKDGERSVGVQPFQYGEAFRVFRFDLPWEPPRADSEAPLREA